MEGSFTQVSHYTIPVSRALTISTVVLFLKETLQTEIHFVYYFPLLISKSGQVLNCRLTAYFFQRVNEENYIVYHTEIYKC